MATDTDIFQFSEFSMYEILYMGHEALTYIVDTTLDEATFSDPFDAVAAAEEAFGYPLALNLRRTPM